MKEYFTKDLSDGLVMDGVAFAVQNFAVHKDKNGNPYYRIELQDKTGDIAGKVWSDSLQYCNLTDQNIGDVVNVTGIVSAYQGKLQLTIKKCELTEDYELEDLIQVTNKGIEELFARIQEHVDSIKDINLRKLFDKMFADEEFTLKFKESPAAEIVHHDFVGGLMEHVVEILDIAESLKPIYPEANFDLVKTGILLHDIGKTEELERVGTAFVRTKLGKVIGHLPMSVEIAKRYLSEDFPKELWLHIWHIILSHHGLLEYGSPVVPKTLEAAIVHHLDYMLSHVEQYAKALEVAEGDAEFTNYERLLGTDLYAVPYVSKTAHSKSSGQEITKVENRNGETEIDEDQVALI